MSFGGMGMMGIAQNMPSPSELEACANDKYTEDCYPQVAKFCGMLSQILKQQGVSEQVENPTEAMTLYCPTCSMGFAVNDPAGYHAKVKDGFLYACENNHEQAIVGSGRRGMMTEEEESASRDNPTIVVIYGDGAQSAPPASSDS